MRALAFSIVALLACDAGSKPKVQPNLNTGGRRDVKKTSELALTDLELGAALPKHGVIVATYGMGGYRLIEVLDLDGEVLNVMEQDWDPSHGIGPLQEGRLDVAHDMIPMFREHGEKAWREVQHGNMPDVTDVAQVLYVIDGNDAFELHGTLIGSGATNLARPAAGDLVDLVQALDRDLREKWRRHS